MLFILVQTKCHTSFANPSFTTKFMDMETSDTAAKENSVVEEIINPEPPHEALFLVLAYLPLLDLLAMREVCRLLKDAVNKDVLLWLNIIVDDRPLNSRISDGILAEITSKANGRLQTLALMNCVKITDDGLLWVIERNPFISKLYVPECTGLTPEGVIITVKTLTKRCINLKSLKIDGIYNINKEHLETLGSCLAMNWGQQEQHQQLSFYHYGRNFSALGEMGCSIDVDICPKCTEVRMVFDCPRETCKTKREQHPLTECRGCNLCIPRCEQCGVCVTEFEEQGGEAVCADVLCLNCWFQLPKCNFCNKPYCNRHAYQQCRYPNSTGFVCGVCHVKFIKT